MAAGRRKAATLHGTGHVTRFIFTANAAAAHLPVPHAAHRLDDDAHAESSFEVTLRPGHAIHPARSLAVPSLPPPASKSSSDHFPSYSADKMKSGSSGNVVLARGWGGGQTRPQGRSVKWGAAASPFRVLCAHNAAVQASWTAATTVGMHRVVSMRRQGGVQR